MSTEMSSVKSAPSSFALSIFDRVSSFSPTLIDRRKADIHFCMIVCVCPALSRQHKVTGCLFLLYWHPSLSQADTHSKQLQHVCSSVSLRLDPELAESTQLAKSRWGGVDGWSRRSRPKVSVRGHVLQACGRSQWETGTDCWATRWLGSILCQWGERTLHLPFLSEIFGRAVLLSQHASFTEACRTKKFKLGRGWVENQPCTWCRVDMQGIGGGHPNMIWEYGKKSEWDWLEHLGRLSGQSKSLSSSQSSD